MGIQLKSKSFNNYNARSDYGQNSLDLQKLQKSIYNISRRIGQVSKSVGGILVVRSKCDKTLGQVAVVF
jgi:hypothetical protein